MIFINIILFFEMLFFAIIGIVLIYLIAKRVGQKKNEDFEKRDN